MDAITPRDFADFQRFVNPATATRVHMGEEPYRFTAVVDGRLIDDQGRHFQDFLAGWGTQAFGHCARPIMTALGEFLQQPAPMVSPAGISPYAGRLARRLFELSSYDAAYFASGGAEAVEAALKLARAATGKPRIACLTGAYHGCTYGSVAMMHDGFYRDGFGPHLPAVDRLTFDDIEVLEGALADPELAAFVLEPIQVESGLRQLSTDYLARLCQLTAERGVMLVADEIQTGMGRCGRFLHSENWPRRPDVVLLGKALGGGAMPISAMLTQRAIFDRAYGSFALAESHASTFSGNALACVAGLAALELLNDQQLTEIRAKGQLLRDELVTHIAPLPLVSAIRGEGLLWGIELRTPDHPYFHFDYLGLPELAHQPLIGLLLVHRLHKAGYLTQICGHAWHTLRVHPPYTTSSADLKAFVLALAEALNYLWSLQ